MMPFFTNRMNKKIILGFIVLVVAGVSYYFYASRGPSPIAEVEQSYTDFKNATYNIDGNEVTLVNGEAETETAPNSASKMTTWYFGNEAVGDLNGDDKEDTAFLLAQDSGGSGLFYYAVVALKYDDGYKMTNTFFVGDRIAPQSTEIISRELRVNFAERKAGEPMTANPSVGATLLLKVTRDGVLEGLMR